MASGRPILAAAEGEVANLIKRYGAGLVCPPEDAKALAQMIRKMRTIPSVQLEQMGRSGYQAVHTEFSRSSLGKKYSAIFEDTVKSFQEHKS
jgi:colanic acid biosynthesis glycosyl transferase WcaI